MTELEMIRWAILAYGFLCAIAWGVWSYMDGARFPGQKDPDE